MAERVDITIFAATGFMGKCVVEEFLKCDQTRNLSWAIAGRNKEKLRQVLEWASKKTGQDVFGVPIVIAECNDQRSLDKMAKGTRVVISCCGPYDYYMTSVIKACTRNCTYLVDASHSKLISAAQEMLKKNKDEELDRIYGHKESAVVGTPLKSSHEEESDHPERRKKSRLVRKSTKNSPGVELDHLDGRHIEENLGLHRKKLIDFIFPNYWPVVVVLLLVLLAFSFGYDIFVTHLNKANDLSEANILAILKPLTRKFISQQQNLWVQIFTGFTNLIRSPASPAVFLLLSDRKSETTSPCVVEIIRSIANKIIPYNEKWLFLNGSELSNAKSRDCGILVEMIAKKKDFSRVVVVSDIHKIPGPLAAGFHFLVDQENPKIRDAVYVFTMTIDEIDGQVKPLRAVEKTLVNSWSDLGENILFPLITRVTEAVLHIAPEEKIGACPLKTDSMYEIRIP